LRRARVRDGATALIPRRNSKPPIYTFVVDEISTEENLNVFHSLENSRENPLRNRGSGFRRPKRIRELSIEGGEFLLLQEAPFRTRRS
jgi:hypothetical protein